MVVTGILLIFCRRKGSTCILSANLLPSPSAFCQGQRLQCLRHILLSKILVFILKIFGVLQQSSIIFGRVIRFLLEASSIKGSRVLLMNSKGSLPFLFLPSGEAHGLLQLYRLFRLQFRPTMLSGHSLSSILVSSLQTGKLLQAAFVHEQMLRHNFNRDLVFIWLCFA